MNYLTVLVILFINITTISIKRNKMKYLICADLHGNIESYVKLKTIADSILPDKIILLGDLCDGFGEESINNELRKIFYPIIAVKGNCDSTNVFSKLQLGDKGRFFCENIEKRNLFFTHGHIYGMNIPPVLGKGDVIFFGHFHVPEISKSQGVLRVCVGSLGKPRGYAPPTYCILSDNAITLFNANNNEPILKTFLEEIYD